MTADRWKPRVDEPQRWAEAHSVSIDVDVQGSSERVVVGPIPERQHPYTTWERLRERDKPFSPWHTIRFD